MGRIETSYQKFRTKNRTQICRRQRDPKFLCICVPAHSKFIACCYLTSMIIIVYFVILFIIVGLEITNLNFTCITIVQSFVSFLNIYEIYLPIYTVYTMRPK